MLERSSALNGVLKKGGRDGADGQRRLQLGEERGWNLLQVAAFATTAAELEQAVRRSMGVDLPEGVGHATSIGTRLLLRTGPEQFWIITRDGEDMTTTIQTVVAPANGTITPLSHSRTCIWLEGSPSREVLAMGLAVDLHPDVFTPNSFALTGLHHTPVMILRSGATRFELYVLRTFAVWTWEWLTDAALRYGYDVVLSS
jgi:methylglutamate dehydrogenase subunit D